MRLALLLLAFGGIPAGASVALLVAALIRAASSFDAPPFVGAFIILLGMLAMLGLSVEALRRAGGRS